MAILKDLTGIGHFVINDEGHCIFAGRDEDNRRISIAMLGKDKSSNGTRLPIQDNDLRELLKESITNSAEAYIRRNKRLSVPDKQKLRSNIPVMVDDFYKKDSFLNFSSVSGFYSKAAKRWVLSAEAIKIETENGAFFSIKNTTFHNEYGKNYLPVKTKWKHMIEGGRIEDLTYADILNINPQKAYALVEPIKQFMTSSDLDYLLTINENKIKERVEDIKERGEHLTFQKPKTGNTQSNVRPDLKISLQKTILKYVGGEYKALEAILNDDRFNFSIPLKINDKSMTIDKDNLTKNMRRNLLNVCFEYTLSKCDNSYAKLFKLLNASGEGIQQAVQFDKFKKSVDSIHEARTPKAYNEGIANLKSLIKSVGLTNSPIRFEMPLSTIDSLKKLNNDSSYRIKYNKSMKDFFGSMLENLKENIISQINIYEKSTTPNGIQILENIKSRVEPVIENGKTVNVNFKKDEKGKTILDYMKVNVKGQLPILHGNEQYPAKTLKGMINNNIQFTPFGNRGHKYGIESSRLLNMLGIPTVITRQKQNIEIDIKNDKTSMLVEQQNNVKTATEPTEQVSKKENEKSTVPKETESKAMVTFNESKVVEVTQQKAGEIKKEETLSIDINEDAMLELLSDMKVPKAGKAEEKTKAITPDI